MKYTDIGDHVCSTCNKVFKNGYAWSGHQNAHRNKPPPQPPTVFSSSSSSSSSEDCIDAYIIMPRNKPPNRTSESLITVPQKPAGPDGYKARGLLKVRANLIDLFPNYLPQRNRRKDDVEVSESETTITNPMFCTHNGEYEGDSEVSSKSVGDTKIKGNGNSDLGLDLNSEANLDLDLKLGPGVGGSSSN